MILTLKCKDRFSLLGFIDDFFAISGPKGYKGEMGAKGEQGKGIRGETGTESSPCVSKIEGKTVFCLFVCLFMASVNLFCGFWPVCESTHFITYMFDNQ